MFELLRAMERNHGTEVFFCCELIRSLMQGVEGIGVWKFISILSQGFAVSDG